MLSCLLGHHQSKTSQKRILDSLCCSASAAAPQHVPLNPSQTNTQPWEAAAESRCRARLAAAMAGPSGHYSHTVRHCPGQRQFSCCRLRKKCHFRQWLWILAVNTTAAAAEVMPPPACVGQQDWITARTGGLRGPTITSKGQAGCQSR